MRKVVGWAFLGVFILVVVVQLYPKDTSPGVHGGFLRPSYIAEQIVDDAITQDLTKKCPDCEVVKIKHPYGYPIGKVSTLHYEVTYRKNDKLYDVYYYLGYELREYDLKRENVIHLAMK